MYQIHKRELENKVKISGKLFQIERLGHEIKQSLENRFTQGIEMKLERL